MFKQAFDNFLPYVKSVIVNWIINGDKKPTRDINETFSTQNLLRNGLSVAARKTIYNEHFRKQNTQEIRKYRHMLESESQRNPMGNIEIF